VIRTCAGLVSVCHRLARELIIDRLFAECQDVIRHSNRPHKTARSRCSRRVLAAVGVTEHAGTRGPSLQRLEGYRIRQKSIVRSGRCELTSAAGTWKSNARSALAVVSRRRNAVPGASVLVTAVPRKMCSLYGDGEVMEIKWLGWGGDRYRKYFTVSSSNVQSIRLSCCRHARSSLDDRLPDRVLHSRRTDFDFIVQQVTTRIYMVAPQKSKLRSNFH